MFDVFTNGGVIYVQAYIEISTGEEGDQRGSGDGTLKVCKLLCLDRYMTMNLGIIAVVFLARSWDVNR